VKSHRCKQKSDVNYNEKFSSHDVLLFSIEGKEARWQNGKMARRLIVLCPLAL
jgi:hypothetical protein